MRTRKHHPVKICTGSVFAHNDYVEGRLLSLENEGGTKYHIHQPAKIHQEPHCR